MCHGLPKTLGSKRDRKDSVRGFLNRLVSTLTQAGETLLHILSVGAPILMMSDGRQDIVNMTHSVHFTVPCMRQVTERMSREDRESLTSNLLGRPMD